MLFRKNMMFLLINYFLQKHVVRGINTYCFAEIDDKPNFDIMVINKIAKFYVDLTSV